MTVRQPHPIEVRSYEILRSRVDLSPMPPLWRAVAERVIHATADLEYAVDLVTTEDFLVQGWSALRSGAPIVTDEHMTAAGISARETACHADDPAAARMARAAGITRPAAAVRIAYSEVGPGAVWVVGSAPEAIFEIIARRVRPALVVGTPVGFVGAAEAKEALRASGLPQLSNVSEKGGPAVAAAAVNALLYFEQAPQPFGQGAPSHGQGAPSYGQGAPPFEQGAPSFEQGAP
ncbi:precorrin-8X methylmutase [Actinomadura nitritigenes]|uniref:precorrin-8X methylmutase n=1 Tax=Actinomadura nitritigenes TaxID=134602 RepID=UPI003D8D18B8